MEHTSCCGKNLKILVDQAAGRGPRAQLSARGGASHAPATAARCLRAVPPARAAATSAYADAAMANQGGRLDYSKWDHIRTDDEEKKARDEQKVRAVPEDSSRRKRDTVGRPEPQRFVNHGLRVAPSPAEGRFATRARAARRSASLARARVPAVTCRPAQAAMGGGPREVARGVPEPAAGEAASSGGRRPDLRHHLLQAHGVAPPAPRAPRAHGRAPRGRVVRLGGGPGGPAARRRVTPRPGPRR